MFKEIFWLTGFTHFCRVGYLHVVPFQFELLYFPSLNPRFCQKRTRWTMRECHKYILQKLIVELVKDLEPEPLLLYLYQKEIIYQDDMDEVRSKKIRKDVNEDLIFMLMRRGPELFQILLRDCKANNHFWPAHFWKKVK